VALAVLLALAVARILAPTALAHAAESAIAIPAPAVDAPVPGDGLETAMVAGGCFWGVQDVFAHVQGVTLAVAGYAGGTTVAPSYEAVSAGDTGHAESVHITFDARVISYGKRHCSADSEITIDRADDRFYTTGPNLLLLRGAHHVRTG